MDQRIRCLKILSICGGSTNTAADFFLWQDGSYPWLTAWNAAPLTPPGSVCSWLLQSMVQDHCLGNSFKIDFLSKKLPGVGQDEKWRVDMCHKPGPVHVAVRRSQLPSWVSRRKVLQPWFWSWQGSRSPANAWGGEPCHANTKACNRCFVLHKEPLAWFTTWFPPIFLQKIL